MTEDRLRAEIKDNTGLIFAPDLNDIDKIEKVIVSAAPHLDGIKFHTQEHKAGLDNISRLKRKVLEEHDFSPYIMADEKLADIPPRNAAMVRNYATVADGITVQAFPGPFSLESAINEAKKYDMDVLVVCAMTQAGAPSTFDTPLRADIGEALKYEFERAQKLVDKGKMESEIVKKGYEAFAEGIMLDELLKGNTTIAEYNALIAKTLGAKAIIAPGNQVEVLKKFREGILGWNIEIWSPGFIDQGGKVRDAFQYANRGIIGGGIYNAENPGEAAEKIGSDIRRAKNAWVEC